MCLGNPDGLLNWPESLSLDQWPLSGGWWPDEAAKWYHEQISVHLEISNALRAVHSVPIVAKQRGC